MRLLCRALQTTLRRRPIHHATALSPRPYLSLQKRSPAMSQSPFGTSGGANSTRQQEMDDNLLKMDIDAAERHMRDHFGDHATWSHEKLLKLFYCKSTCTIIAYHLTRTSRRTYPNPSYAKFRRLCDGRHTSPRWKAVLPVTVT
jgi:hypothetical protein